MKKEAERQALRLVKISKECAGLTYPTSRAVTAKILRQGQTALGLCNSTMYLCALKCSYRDKEGK